jgi:hypothetical protein
MEQRPLRLGDILDDYCPRERRVTNHAVVAMIEETVKQTRCTTCDAEHPYKGGQAPRRRKKDGPSALYKEVLAGKSDNDVPSTNDMPSIDDVPAPEVFAAVAAAEDSDAADDDVNGNVMSGRSGPPAHSIMNRQAPAVRRELPPEAPPPILDDAGERVQDPEDGPVHRQLIRATLPRIEGHKEERKPTDFTIRQPGGRGNNVGNHFRGGGGNDRSRAGGRGGPGGSPGNPGGNPGQRGNGHRPQGGGPRFAGARSGQGQGQGQGHGRGPGGGFRSAQQPRPGGGGRKRSR